MKCVCGYDDSAPDKDMFGDPVLFVITETSLKIRIPRDYRPDDFTYEPIYFCPKCGTLKVGICNGKRTT